MKHYLSLIFFAFLSLTGCVSNHNPNLHGDLTQEVWMREVETNPNRWAVGTDSWFQSGTPTTTEDENRDAPATAAISTMTVRVADFTNIKTAGDFQLEIFGTYSQNSVYVSGPNDGVRQISVGVHGNTLNIIQMSNPTRAVRRVIVRIGMNQLNSLSQVGGCGKIEGIRINSNGLYITTTPMATGNIYLAGNMLLRRVYHAGNGCINLFGANTPGAEIKTTGAGSLNMSGNFLNIKTIRHAGTGSISVIGARSDGLRIFATGGGKISINGQVNLREVKASGRMRVFAYPVTSEDLTVSADTKSRVGVAGYATNLIVNTTGAAKFKGRYLCTRNAYVRAHDWSHINVAAVERVFTSATQNSSVYFFGAPNAMSQFVSGNGVVIPMWSSTASSCSLVFQRVSYNGEREKALVYTPKPAAKPVRVAKVTTHKIESYSNSFLSQPEPQAQAQYHGRKVKEMVKYQNY